MNECSSSAVSPADLSPSIQTTPLRASMAAGGQLSPPAADSAGAQDQQAPGASSSSASSDLTGDAEGVWSSDIDQAFQEALAIYPPCGRRKIIISDEGKMYGRNELIARYIKIRCGKTRTRKQVSSHIQVLARKKARDEVAKKKGFQPDSSPCAPAPSAAAASVSAVAAAALAAANTSPPTTTAPPQPARVPLPMPGFPQIPTIPLQDAKEQLQLLQKTALLPGMYGTLWGTPFQMPQSFNPEMKFAPDLTPPFTLAQQTAVKCESPAEMQKLTVSSSQLTLNGFTAYVEGPSGDRVDIVNIPKYVGDIEKLKLSDISDKYPKLLPELFVKGPSDAFYLAKCWANVHFSAVDSSHLFAVDSYYSSSSHFDITVSTKVCSFGNEVVEKVEVYSAQEEGGQYSFRLEKSPMCDYMVRFISELKKLESETWMNNVLENFTVLQVITNKTTQETLMVLCFVFEVNRDPETTCSLFRLTA